MPETVLLVEDEALIALDEARMLEKHGYAVRTVHTGKAAVETAVQEPAVSLVLMDIDLGEGMDGTDAARAILERRELPVVFLTSHTEEEYVNRVEAITSYGIVQKSSGEFFIIQAVKMAYRLFDAHRQTQLHERKYRLIAENAGEMITTSDENFRPTYVSPAVESILGYTQEEYLSKTSEELLTPDSFARAVHAYRTREPGDTSPQRLEVEMIRKDGSRVWCESFTKPFFDEEGRRVGTIVTTRDISKHKQAEEELLESERRAKHRLRNIEFLAETAFDLIDSSKGEVLYTYIGKSLQRLVPGAYIAVNSLHADTVELKTEVLLGIGQHLETVISRLGYHPVGSSYRYDSSLDGLATGKLERFEGGLHELTFGEIPAGVARSLEKMFGVKNIYAIAFMVDRSIYANAIFILPKGRDIRNAETIEAFAKQASLALKRQKTEAELRHSRERLRAVADYTYDWEDWIDTEGRLVWVNPAVKRIAGYSPAECYRMTDYPKPLVHEDDWPLAKEEMRKGLEEGVALAQREFRCICRDGSRKWISVSLQPIYDEQGQALGIRSSLRDITSFKRTRESLRSIVEYAPVGFFYLDPDFRITYENPAARRIIGVPEGEGESKAMGRDIRELSSVGKVVEPAEIERIASGEEQVRFETYFESIYGRKRYLRVYAVPMRHRGVFDGTILMVEDMTDRREYERINEERTLYMEAILTATPNAILTLDTENRIKEWNPGAERLFGYTKEEVIGRDLDELVGGGDDCTYDEALALTRQVSGGRPVPPTETVRYTKGGEPLNVIVAGSPIMVDGTFTGIVATYTNITRLKGKEEEVKKLLHEKEQLLYEVHHRIKNHMGTILSILSLHSSSSDDPAIINALEEVQNKIRIMQNIYQTLYTGEYVDSVHVSSFLDALIEDIEATYVSRESVRIETGIENVEVTAKQSLPIGIIVNELVTNSIKYAFAEHEEGHIRVELEQQDDRSLRITVDDDGEGISDEIIRTGNYGFGLTLVQSYAHQFDGEMEVDNRGGNRVTVTLGLE